MSELRRALKKWYIALPFYSLFVFLYLFCVLMTAGALRLLLPWLSKQPWLVAAVIPALLYAIPPLALRFSTISSSAAGKAVRRHLHSFSSCILTSYLYLLLCIFGSGTLGILAIAAGWLPRTAQTYRIFLLLCLGLFLFIHIVGFCSAEFFRVRRISCRLSKRRTEGGADTDAEPGEFLSPGDDKAPASLKSPQNSLRIALLSDLHFGFFTEKSFFLRVFRRIEKEKPDILLIVGDLFDYSFDDLSKSNRKAILAGFQRLLPALSLGIYACEGNHDRISAAGDLRSAEDQRVTEFLTSCGIRMLRDEAVTLALPHGTGELLLIGRKDSDAGKNGGENGRADGETGRKSPALLLTGLPSHLPKILLDHRPKEIPALAAAGADLVLCGHVHNGQSFPGNLLHRMLSRYSYGKAVTGNCLSYTTSGCGRWTIPLRFLTADELVLLTVLIP